MTARIAVIDDDADFRQFMADALGDYGWDVLLCADPLGIYDLLRVHTPDLIMLDLRMQGQLVGWDILTFLQLHPTLHEIPVVMCTAAVDEVEERETWLHEHGVSSLLKPFELDDLYSLLEERLRSRQPALPSATTA